MLRVGYWMSEKKIKKLDFDQFHEFCSNGNVQLVKIDLSKSLESQGPFDVILHKLTDHIARAHQGNQEAASYIKCLKEYIDLHPETIILDPLDNVCQLLDRKQQYEIVEVCQKSQKEILYFTPSFVELTKNNLEENVKKIQAANVKFPVVCKPTVAHGSSMCHQMSLVFHEGGLTDVRFPCVAQTFIPHSAILYKVFVIGQQYFLVERPSIKDFTAQERETIHFDSHDVSKADSASFLNQVDDSVGPQPEVNEAHIHKLTKDIQQQLNLTLFGVDVIIDNKTGQYAVIDINAFPGYDGVPEFFPALMQLIKTKVQESGEEVKSAHPKHSSQSKSPKEFHLTANGLTQPNKTTTFSQSILSRIGSKENNVDVLQHDLRGESSKCF